MTKNSKTANVTHNNSITYCISMVAFNRQNSKTRAIVIKQRRARTQAKLGHSDMKLKHPDWCRDANDGHYTVMDKSIKKECEDKQLRQETFTTKLHQDG